MIELLLVQTITNLALAAVVIKLRRELWPMIAGADPPGSGGVGFWIRSIDVLLVEMPLLTVAKSVTRVRWLFSEELHLTYRLRVYDVAMRPSSRVFYKEWREWMQGSSKYDCRVKKPRGLARLYSKAIDVVCFDREEEERKFREEVQKYLSTPTKYRKRRYKRWRKPRPRRERATLYDLVEKFEKLK
jgi:hypothetical protein